MEKVWPIYCAFSALAYIACATLVVSRREEFSRLTAGYARFLLAPWKAATFILAAGFLTVIAPYTGDPTWDHLDALFMSVLTYLTAPWALGAIIRAGKRLGPLWLAAPAICIWHFSASLSYDVYILVTMKIYPPTWATNMIASSYLYGMAGLMWNVDWTRSRGLHLAFSRPDWPKAAEDTDAIKALYLAGPIALVVGFAVVYVFFIM
jgi:hypothetical protein